MHVTKEERVESSALENPSGSSFLDLLRCEREDGGTDRADFVNEIVVMVEASAKSCDGVLDDQQAIAEDQPVVGHGL